MNRVEGAIIEEANALEALAGNLDRWRTENLHYRGADGCAELLDAVADLIGKCSRAAETMKLAAGDVARDTVNEARREG